MSEIKDWRGTPITVGAKVITRSATKFPTWRIGIVTNIGKTGAITVASEATSDFMPVRHRVQLYRNSVTVLTKDMLDE